MVWVRGAPEKATMMKGGGFTAGVALLPRAHRGKAGSAGAEAGADGGQAQSGSHTDVLDLHNNSPLFFDLVLFLERFVGDTRPFHTQLPGKLQQVEPHAVDHHGEEAHDQVQRVTHDHNQGRDDDQGPSKPAAMLLKLWAMASEAMPTANSRI